VVIAEVETVTMEHVNHGELGREHDHADVRCRRLLFRSWNRGTQESDLILGSFAETSLLTFDSAQLDRLESLLDCSDPDLFDWIFGVTPPPAQHDHDVMRHLRDFCIARQIIPHAQQQS
jgi:antitoxin CptB